MQELKSINFFKIQNVDHLPFIQLHGPYLFDTNFFPGQYLKAEIYEDKIVITKATD